MTEAFPFQCKSDEQHGTDRQLRLDSGNLSDHDRLEPFDEPGSRVRIHLVPTRLFLAKAGARKLYGTLPILPERSLRGMDEFRHSE